MSTGQFGAAERYAIYTVHGEKCYMCTKVIDLFEVEIDHVIPEALLNNVPKLQEVLHQFGLPPHFDLQSYSNLLPSCKRCNTAKQQIVFNPTPLIQRHLQQAEAKSSKVSLLVKKTLHRQTIARCWNVIERAQEAGTLPENIWENIREFAAFHVENRPPEMKSEPILLTPLYSVISEANEIRMIQGPYGRGIGPVDPNPSFRCSGCGNAAWNGARCVICGQMDDD